ncbi:hydroxymethylbilane synthase [Clostridium kluyveri]|uniref:hydroxymethylbilane synthase n=1 Tax=Clostridium kluyveri TaxID=1534 RepID=UPI0022460334|nr:hydroxymethylbilane synthase [Clostridium kluyveri]UZQ51886.1 hydroxymethylbilane synthase [Clostridium kluyveri]
MKDEGINLSFKIATRKSRLALVQTEYIINLLTENFGIECEKVLIKTEGDRKLNVSLDKIGGKGLFVKDIEKALMERRAEAAVHSMKDMPNELLDLFEIIAMPIREDVRDVFISREGMKFSGLPKGAIIGTSSKRRAVQIKSLRYDIKIVPVRGNIETRIKKMHEQKLDGIVLAAAGVKRLNMTEVITEYFDPLKFVPAVAQGAIGVEALKSSEYASVLKKIDNEDVRIGVEAERSFLKKLGGDCHTPVGAYSIIEGETLNITGIFQIGTELIKKDICGSKWDYISLGERLGEKIIRSCV